MKHLIYIVIQHLLFNPHYQMSSLLLERLLHFFVPLKINICILKKVKDTYIWIL